MYFKLWSAQSVKWRNISEMSAACLSSALHMHSGTWHMWGLTWHQLSTGGSGSGSSWGVPSCGLCGRSTKTRPSRSMSCQDQFSSFHRSIGAEKGNNQPWPSTLAIPDKSKELGIMPESMLLKHFFFQQVHRKHKVFIQNTRRPTHVHTSFCFFFSSILKLSVYPGGF